MRGYDCAKKLTGGKRHLLVDAQGLVLRAVVHTAALQDRAAIPLLLAVAPERFPRAGRLWADQGYTGSGREWIERELGRSVEVVQHPPKPRGDQAPLGTGDDPRPFEWRRLPPERTGFRGVLPSTWVEERTFSRIGEQPPPQQGLRAALRDRRGPRVRRHEPDHDPPTCEKLTCSDRL